MLPLHIVSTGTALPALQVSAADIDAMHAFTPGYALKKGGVRQRRFATNTDSQSALAAEAVHNALKRAQLPASGLDLIISACAIQEQALPATACAIAARLDLAPGTPAFDVNASCLGFLAALRVAAGLLNTGGFRRIAVVAADLASRGLNWSDPESSVIFGDGAAAAIVERGDGSAGIESFKMATYPEGRHFCEVRAGGTRRNPCVGVDATDHLFRMDGKAVFKLAARVVPDFVSELMAESGHTLDSMDAVVPHQASHLAMSHIMKLLKLPPERLVNIYENNGNQVSASIPCALHAAYGSGQAAPGKRILILGTAGGLTVGGMVIRL